MKIETGHELEPPIVKNARENEMFEMTSASAPRLPITGRAIIRKAFLGALVLVVALTSGCAGHGYTPHSRYRAAPYVEPAEIVARHSTGATREISRGLALYGRYGSNEWRFLDRVLREFNR
jgi:hypothetical protein